MFTEQKHKIIGMIYDAILNHKWDQVLAEIVKYTNSHSGILTILDQLEPMSNLTYTHNLPQELVKIYQDEEIRVLDMEIHQPKLKQAGGVGHAVTMDWSPYASMLNTKENILYEKCIRPSGVIFATAMLIEERKYRWGLLGVHRTQEMQVYGKEECKKLENLVVHLRRALQIYRYFNTVQQKYYDFHQILNNLKIGVILVDVKGRLVYANLVAKNILESYSSLLWVDRFAQLKTKEYFQGQLNQYISSIFFASEDSEDFGGVLVLYEQPDQPLLKLSITPLSHTSIFNTNDEDNDRAMIFINTMQQQYRLSISYLSQTYNLTKREIAICESFVNGRGLEKIAEELSITLSSLRTYFKYIYEKTGCNSQIELMYLLMSITLDFEHII